MITRKFLLSALTLLAIVFTPGCKDDEAEFVSMNVSTKTLLVGETFQFEVMVQSTTNSVYNGSVEWSVDESVASIDQTGLLTAKMPSGDKGVIVKAKIDNGRYAIARLYVNSREISSPSSLYIERKVVNMASSITDTLHIWVAPEYADANCYPVSVKLNKLNDDGTIDENAEVGVTSKIYPYVGAQPSAEGSGDDAEATQNEGVVYVLELTSTAQNENIMASVSMGDLIEKIEIHVDFSLYLSLNPIDPTVPYDNIGSVKPLELKASSEGEMTLYFYVQDNDDPNASLEKVKKELLDDSNYKITTPDGLLVLGEPVITQQANSTYKLTRKVIAGSGTGVGQITITIFDRKVTYNVFVDDGEAYNAVYISFTDPNTYTIPPTEMTLIKSVTADMSEAGSAPNTFKILVYHYISPDTRAPHIDWNVNISDVKPSDEERGDEEPSDAKLIKYLGKQNKNSKQTEFEFEVGTSTGTATIDFKVYNPQGELGGEYEQYKEQTITATVTIRDKSEIVVNSVKFVDNSEPSAEIDNIETPYKAVPIQAVMDPAESSAAWPIKYSIIEGDDLAKISETPTETGGTTYSLNIDRAGVIKVKAEAGPDNNKKSDILTVTAKFQLDRNSTNPLEITKAPKELSLGETSTITTILHANYTAEESRYTWRSSRPDIVSVDQHGNVTALAEGSADITVEIKDDYNYYAAAVSTITVRELNISADFNTLPDGYYVINNVDGEFWVDMEEEGASGGNYYTFNLNKDILSMGDGVYTAGTAFTGTVIFPDQTTCNITGGTITVSVGNVTFDLTVSSGSATGTITGTKPLL